MAAGKAWHEIDAFLLKQEDDWERTARVLAMLHNTSILISRSMAGGTVEKSDLKSADDFNDWLDIGGADECGIDRGSQSAFDLAIEEERTKREAVKRGK